MVLLCPYYNRKPRSSYYFPGARALDGDVYLVEISPASSPAEGSCLVAILSLKVPLRAMDRT